MVSKSRELMNFRDDFANFENKVLSDINDLFSKSGTMLSDFTSRIDSIDEMNGKIDRRILLLERETSV